MPGQGKYTKYAPPSNPKNTRLNRLFRGSEKQINLFEDLVGKEDEVREKIIAIAKDHLTPDQQVGDLAVFPNGVSLDYTGRSADYQNPNTEPGGDVGWNEPGDPSTPYTPDLRSPGPGFTSVDGAPNLESAPELTVEELDPGYIPGAPGTGTRSPSKTSPAVHDGVELGAETDLGDSGTENAGS